MEMHVAEPMHTYCFQSKHQLSWRNEKPNADKVCTDCNQI